MPSKLAFTINIKIALPNGKNKYPVIGAIIRNEKGMLFGNLELKPWQEWNGKFYLFPPTNAQGPTTEEVPEVPTEDLTSPPF